MRATLDLTETQLFEAIIDWAKKQGLRNPGQVAITYHPGDRPWDNSSFSASVQGDIPPPPKEEPT